MIINEHVLIYLDEWRLSSDIAITKDENILMKSILGTSQKSAADVTISLIGITLHNYCRIYACSLQNVFDYIKQGGCNFITKQASFSISFIQCASSVRTSDI